MLLIHLTLQLAAIRQTLAENLPMTLLDDADFQGRGIHLRVQRTGDIEVTPRALEARSGAPTDVQSGLRIDYILPLGIDLRKRLLGTQAAASGGIKLELSTRVAFTDDWELLVDTEVISTEWLERPELGFGGLRIGAERLAETIVSRAKAKIADGVDEQLRSRLQPRQLLGKLQQLAQAGAPLPTGGPAGRLHPRLAAVGLEIVDVSDSAIQVRLGAEADPLVTLSKAAALATPSTAEVFKPLRRVRLPAKGRIEHVLVQITPESLAALLRQALTGLRIERFGRHVEVIGSEVRADENLLYIELDVEGTIRGTITLSGKPVFDADSAQVQLHNAHLDVATQSGALNVLAKALRHRIVKEVNAQLGLRIHEGLQRALTTINTKVSMIEPVEGIEVAACVESLALTEVDHDAEALYLGVELSGSANINVRRIPQPPA